MKFGLFNFLQNEIFSFIFWGGTITLVNLILFYFLNLILDYRVAEIIAIVFCRIYAYIVNKKFVFHVKKKDKKGEVREVASFIFFRGVTGLVDILGMTLLVSYFNTKEVFAKVIITLLVVTLNYIFNKFFVFNNKC